jgi:hypothetical protein
MKVEVDNFLDLEL